MRTKPFVIFWGATAAAVLFLGALWSTAGLVSRHPTLDAAVTVVAALGLAASLFVAGRIVVVMGRLRRLDRAAPSPRPAAQP